MATDLIENIDPATITGFGKEWAAFDQSKLVGEEYQDLFDAYFAVFPFESLPPSAEGFDLGCGSGRWAAGMAPKVGVLHCIDPAPQALAVAQRRLKDQKNVRFHLASTDRIPLPDSSQDFGYSLGVLHHIPDTALAMRDCVAKLKPGAPFLIYIYYAFDNRPTWFRALWRVSNLLRRGISRIPFTARRAITTGMATLAYWPLARSALLAEQMGFDPQNMPLSAYRHRSFYTMRTDALDRFGTVLENRFTQEEIRQMMEDADLEQIRFHEGVPYWTACGIRRGS